MQLKHLILVALCVTCALCADPTDVCTTAGTNQVKARGVCQQCHPSCKTCKTGALETDCDTCESPQTKQSDGKCNCGTKKFAGASTLACDDASPAKGNCPDVVGYFFKSGACSRGSWKFKKTADELDTCPGATDSDCCWGGVTASSSLCPQIDAKPVLIGSDKAFVKDEVINGYYVTAGFEVAPCALGCSACTASKECTACLGNFKVDSTEKKCECTADGYFEEDIDTCSKMIENCKTQTKKDICDACDTDYGTPKANDTTKKSTDESKCEKPTTTTDNTTTTTTVTVDAAADGCVATFYGCTKCDTTGDKKCTACNATKFWELVGTPTATAACQCMKDHIGSTKDKKDCGLACDPKCETGKIASLDATVTPAKCKCITGTATTTDTATTSGMLLTVASMVMAVILA